MSGQRVFVLDYKWTTKPLAPQTETTRTKDAFHFTQSITFIECLGSSKEWSFRSYIDICLIKPATSTWKPAAPNSASAFLNQRHTKFLLFLPPNNSVIDIEKDPSLFLLFSISYLHFEARSKQRVATAIPRIPRFSPDEARVVSFLICSFTLFHFSLPSSFHLINKHTLQPTFIEQLGSNVPSHFLTIHRVLWGGVGWSGGGVQAGTPFHLKPLLEEQCTVLGWIRNPSTWLCPNRRQHSGSIMAPWKRWEL